MKGIVCHFTKIDKTTLASARIANWIANRYDFDIIDRPSSEKVQDYEVAVCVSSPSGFADPELREQVGEICARAKHYVFAQNDYMTSQAGQIGKHFNLLGKDRTKRHVWANMPHVCKNPWDTYINWNMLTWDPQPHKEPTVDGLFYYGACRKDREIYFKKYFGGEAELPYHGLISTSKRGMNKFREVAPYANYIQPFSECKELGKYKMSLYIEDTRIHKYYNSPANRFYECLSNGVAQIFDVSCIGTFEKAGMDISPYVVDSKEHVLDILKQWDKIRNEQYDLWASNYVEQLEIAVDKAIEEIFECKQYTLEM
tara:strand:- start:936 stop:1874 length:939 start_codon:yes stop_codon:yes gene_type:complete